MKNSATHNSVFEYNYNHVTILSELDSDEFKRLNREKSVHYILTLNNLKDINSSECRNLIKFKGATVKLNGLKKISLEVANLLASYKGALHLGIETITPEVANALGSHTGALSFTRLESISIMVLKKLSRYQGNVLQFNFLKKITVHQAKLISAFGGEYLLLNGLKEISVEVARELATYEGFLFLCGLKNLSVEIANELIIHADSLALDGLLTITDEVAGILSLKRGLYLELKGIKKISKQTFNILQKGNSDVTFNSSLEIIN